MTCWTNSRVELIFFVILRSSHENLKSLDLYMRMLIKQGHSHQRTTLVWATLHHLGVPNTTLTSHHLRVPNTTFECASDTTQTYIKYNLRVPERHNPSIHQNSTFGCPNDATEAYIKYERHIPSIHQIRTTQPKENLQSDKTQTHPSDRAQFQVFPSDTAHVLLSDTTQVLIHQIQAPQPKSSYSDSTQVLILVVLQLRPLASL